MVSVYPLGGRYAYAKVVVSYRPCILQAVEDGLYAVVKVIGVTTLIDRDVKPKGASNAFASIDSALVVEAPLIGPYFIIFDDSPSTLLVGDGLVAVGLADRLAPNSLCYHMLCFFPEILCFAAWVFSISQP